ncbi:hypothetical protein [Acetobacterium malicum]
MRRIHAMLDQAKSYSLVSMSKQVKLVVVASKLKKNSGYHDY